MAAVMQVYSALANFESTFDAQTWTIFTREHAEIPIFAVAAYLLVVFQLPLLMGNTKMNLRSVVACWNGLLAVFSAIGFTRVAPVLYSQVRREGRRNVMIRIPPSLIFFSFSPQIYSARPHFRLSSLCIYVCVCVYVLSCLSPGKHACFF